MTDYSFNTIIDTSTLQIGQVVRINFTDDGIFRVFYNDSNGNMYCGLSRQSNYRQVIFDSAHKRTQIDISTTNYIALNKFNPPIYGGTYHEEQTRVPIDRNDKNFYVFKYDIHNQNIFNNYTPVSFFSEIQSQSYIKQGSTSGSIYNSDGYSPILASSKNRFWSSLAVQPDCSFNESVGFFITTRNETTREDRNDISQPGVIPFPDYMDLYGQTINTITNKPLNTNYSHLSNLANNGLTGNANDIRSRFGILNYPYIDTFSRDSNGTTLSIPSLAQSYNILYTLTQKRPKYVWLDISNNATSVDSNGSPGNGQEDTYYKGNFYLYAYTHRDSDVSGNIYIERHNRHNKPKARYEIFSNFANTKNQNQGDIRNIFLDMDLDISKNSTINSGNFNYIYSRPYYVICSDLSGQIVHGTVPYDLSGNSEPLPTEQHIVDISGMSKDQNPDDNFGNSNPFYNLVGTCAKYCKIMVDPTSLNWKTTRYHIIYYAQGGENETDSHIKNTLRWISGEGKSAYDLCGNITTVENFGLYPSMDMSGNVPYVAYLCKGTDTATDISGIGYSYLDNTDANKENWIWTTPRLIATKEDLGGDLTKYTDVSNNHPISLKISPYDYSVHICYQKFNTDGKTSIGYWSNSKNTMDISGIDASLNFLGIKSYGKTIDLSAASVELFWDLSQCNCIFSRDYTRLDENGNTNGLTTPQRKIKIQGYPEGGRNGDFVKSIYEDGVITYRASAFDKLYIIMNIKTPSSWGNTEALFLLGESVAKGAYKSFINTSGQLYFGITNGGYLSSKQISTNNTGAYYKLSYKTDNNNNITLYTGAESLDTNTNYKLEFYYDKSNYYGFIKTTILDTEATNLYEYFDISVNGGFNMLDGNLSIGNGSHTADSNKITNVTIYKMSMYATDISNIPMFDVSRNGEILDDCSGTQFSSFFDNSGNTGLDIEPIINKYQIVNAVNSLNNGDISGSSYDKSVLLNDIYYLQQIEGYFQNTYGEVIKGLSRFDDGEIWAYGYIYNDSGKTSKSTTLWSSFNGLTWSRVPISINGFENFTINNIATFTDNYTTNNGISGKWIYFCGDNDVVYFSSNYDENNQPSTSILGNTWLKLDNGDFLSSTDVSLNYTYIYPTLLDTTLSTNLFLTSPAANDFHLFMGTRSGEDRIVRMGKTKTQSTAAYTTTTYTDYSFTNCGSEGMYGPSLAHCIYTYNNPSSTDKQNIGWNTGGVYNVRDINDQGGGNAFLSVNSSGHLIRDWSNNIWDSVASSVQIFSGASVFQFSIVETSTHCTIGIIKHNFQDDGHPYNLKAGKNGYDYIGTSLSDQNDQIKFGFVLNTAANIGIIENGSIATATTFLNGISITTSDVLKIVIESDYEVKYYKNSTLLYTSSNSLNSTYFPGTSYRIKAGLYSQSGGIKDAVINPDGANPSSRVSMTTQGIQEWTVPTTANYIITANGGSGGHSGYYTSGSTVGSDDYVLGAPGHSITGTFSLTAGDVLQILVGQKGTTMHGASTGAGGGGGTFIIKKNSAGLSSTNINDVLIIAGGGGGAGAVWSGYTSQDKPTTQLTYNTTNTTAGVNGTGYHSGGGAGLISNGADNSRTDSWVSNSPPGVTATGSRSFINGGKGGNSSQNWWSHSGMGGYGYYNRSPGGFGGGGGSGAHSGGGGGGIQGGNGGNSTRNGGKGGYSYFNTNLGTFTTHYHATRGQGSVNIRRININPFPATKEWDLSKNILYNEITSSDLISYSGNDIWDTVNSYNIDLSTPGTIKRGSSANAYWEEWAISKNYFNSKKHNFKLSFKMAGATTNSYVLLNRNFTLSTDVDGNIGHQLTTARLGYGFFIYGTPSSQENKRIGYVIGSGDGPYFVNTDGTYITPTTNNTFTIEVMNEVLNLYMDSTLLLSSNVLVGKNYDLYANMVEHGQVGIKDVVFKPITGLNAISFGQPYRGITDLSDNLSNLGFGIIGGNNYIYTTNNGGKNWTKKLDYPQSTGTTGVYVGQNTKYGDGDSAGDHTYNISGFHIQTNSKPWVGYNGFLVADNNNNYDVSFSPINNSISNPQLYTNNYWEPKTTSLYKLPNTNRDLIENNYKVIISNFKNTNNKSGLKYQQNDIVYTQTPGNNNVLYLKNSDYNHWQKIDVSPINEYYITSQSNYQNGFSSIIPIDISRTVIHIDGNSGYNNMTGFYTVSKVPPTPEIGILYPVSSSDITLAILEVLLDFNKKSYLLKGDNNTALLATEIGDRLRYGIETEYQYQEIGIDIKPWNYIPRSAGDNYLILFTVNVLEQGKRYVFRCRLKNKYGHSEWSNISREISIPAYDPFITNLSYRNKILENKVLWNVGLNNNSQTVYSYDISKSYVNNRYQIVRDYDFDKKYYYNDISGVVGPYSFNFGELETVEWDETNSRDMSFNHIYGTDPSRNLITAGSDVSGNTFNWYYGMSKYVIEKKPEIYDISINFQVTDSSTYFQFGLSDNSNNWNSLHYEFHFSILNDSNDNQVKIVESPSSTWNMFPSSAFNENTIFTIQITKDNKVKFYKDFSSTPFHTSSKTPTYPLYILYRPYHQKSAKKGIFNVQATKISPFDVSNNWTSRFDSSGNEIFDISKVSFIDKDVSFNTTYLYGITARAIPVDGVVKTEYFETSVSSDSGIPEKINYNYKVNNANLTLSWTKVIHISDNISPVWDISWNEKRKDGTENNGIISIEDSSFSFTNGNASYIRTVDYSGATNTYLQPDANYSFQIRGKYSKANQTNLSTFISEFSNLLFYYNYQEPPILKDVSYNLQTNRINALWTEPKTPSIPDYYDISMVNVTSKYDISYNFSQTLNSFSDNGLAYYPGTYKMQIRANFGGYQYPTDINLNSEWSNLKEFNVPYHSIKNLKITPYNKNHIKDLVDVSYIRLDWDDMVKCNLSDNFGINIPDKFYVIRKWSSKGFNYLPDYQKVISKDSVSYLDQTYPLGSEITWPRQYKYDISANYNFDLVAPIISQVTGVVTTGLIDNTPEYTFYTDESGTIVITGASSDTKSASLGNNTISFNTLAPGTYSNITIMIRDSVGNNSNILTVNTFTIDPFPLLTEVTPVNTLTGDNTPTYTFETTHAGTFTITGATTSTSNTAPGLGTGSSKSINFDPLPDGTYNNITIQLTDGHGNKSNILTVSSFTIDTTPPQIYQVTPVTPSLTNNNTPNYTFNSDSAGTIIVSSLHYQVVPGQPSYLPSISNTTAVIGNNTITFNALQDGTYNDIEIQVRDSIPRSSTLLTIPEFTIDTVAPVISEKTTVTTPTKDTTPDYTFSSDKEGTITITGATASPTSVINGDNTITFNTLTQGTYNNIKIKVTDNVGNISNELTISPFTIIPLPQIFEAAAVTTPTNDSTPNYTFNSDSAGTITITGATSSTTNAIVGNNTITFNTLSDNTYDTITIKVTDSEGYDSNILTVSSFTILTVGPVISEQTAVTTPSTDKTPNYTFSSDKAGTITITGGPTSSTTNATVGNNTITFNPLPVGTYNNITIKVTDNVGNVSNTLTVTSFTITEDLTSPQIAEVNPVTTPSSDKTPQYSFSSDEAGTITITGATSSTTNAIVGTNIITFDELSVGTYNDITIKVTDSAENDSNILSVSSFTILDIINISQVTPVPTLTNDNTPQYTFSSDKTGTIIISGASSATTNATVGTNIITFNLLTDGIYNNITIKVRDSYGSDSNTLTVNTFTVDTTGPQINEVTPVTTPTTDTTPQYSFSSDEAGTITITGGPTSSTTNATVGNNTITFNPLPVGTYNNITIKVTDSAGNDSNILTVNNFTIAESIFSVTSSGSSSYLISENGSSLSGNNPSISLQRGKYYVFNINASGHPFNINTENQLGTLYRYSSGITGQGTQSGSMTFSVPQSAPNTLYYNCEYHSSMAGIINITS